jgi:hypothetical protein
MLFAEVFSGSSQAWFINPAALFLPFPLYMAHVLFFLWIALRLKKASLPQLYLFGTLFGLYESWITKVLWAGYQGAAGPGAGTVFGIGVIEFPVLVFFWHPIMSFIMPVLAYEILTGRAISTHKKILEKSRKKTAAITLFLLLAGTFIANGNRFDILSANLSLIGTLLIVTGLYYLSRKKDLKVFEFGKLGFGILTVYLILLYAVTFFLLLPERIPTGIVPYIAILAFYAIPISLIIKSRKTDTELEKLTMNQYSPKDLVKFALVAIVAANLACLAPNISLAILGIVYFSYIVIGVITFTFAVYKVFKHNSSKN